MKNIYKRDHLDFGLKLTMGCILSLPFLSACNSHAADIALDPSRPLNTHKEIAGKYPAYAEKLRELKVEVSSPAIIQANSYARDKTKANSIEYKLGRCSQLGGDWKRQVMDSFPADDGAMKYARRVAGTYSSPESFTVSIPGRDTVLINASGFKNEVYDTTYISLTCHN